MTEAKTINFGTYNSNVFSVTCTRILGTSVSAGALGPPPRADLWWGSVRLDAKPP